jgi:hypothetical protein
MTRRSLDTRRSPHPTLWMRPMFPGLARVRRKRTAILEPLGRRPGPQLAHPADRLPHLTAAVRGLSPRPLRLEEPSVAGQSVAGSLDPVAAPRGHSDRDTATGTQRRAPDSEEPPDPDTEHSPDKANAPLAPGRSVRPSGPTVRSGRPRRRRKSFEKGLRADPRRHRCSGSHSPQCRLRGRPPAPQRR